MTVAGPRRPATVLRRLALLAVALGAVAFAAGCGSGGNSTAASSRVPDQATSESASVPTQVDTARPGGAPHADHAKKSDSKKSDLQRRSRHRSNHAVPAAQDGGTDADKALRQLQRMISQSPPQLEGTVSGEPLRALRHALARAGGGSGPGGQVEPGGVDDPVAEALRQLGIEP